jgi:hypothetical protein
VRKFYEESVKLLLICRKTSHVKLMLRDKMARDPGAALGCGGGVNEVRLQNRTGSGARTGALKIAIEFQ